jgi:hypothetical protein
MSFNQGNPRKTGKLSEGYLINFSLRFDFWYQTDFLLLLQDLSSSFPWDWQKILRLGVECFINQIIHSKLVSNAPHLRQLFLPSQSFYGNRIMILHKRKTTKNAFILWNNLPKALPQHEQQKHLCWNSFESFRYTLDGYNLGNTNGLSLALKWSLLLRGEETKCERKEIKYLPFLNQYCSVLENCDFICWSSQLQGCYDTRGSSIKGSALLKTSKFWSWNRQGWTLASKCKCGNPGKVSFEFRLRKSA